MPRRGEVAVPRRGDWICSSCGQSRAERPGPGESAGCRPPVCRNSWCAAPDRALGAVFAVGNYEGALRRAIVAYKYGSDLRWARQFGILIHGFLVGHANWFEEYGVICPVPSFVGAGARRSWGHVELFCAEVGWRAGAEWPVEQLVVKAVETETMSAKPHPVRRRIARDVLPAAFVAPSIDDVMGRRVVIVDDVCASGGTLSAVAGALRKAGAAEVTGLVLARASWHPGPAREVAVPSVASGP